MNPSKPEHSTSPFPDDELVDLPLDPGRVRPRGGDPPRPAANAGPPQPSKPSEATFWARLAAGLLDVVVHCGFLAAAHLGLYRLDIVPTRSDWPALAVLLLSFSFLYSVVSLVFWGQTAGMVWPQLVARDREDRLMSFPQASLRWLGSLLQLVLVLPILAGAAGYWLSDFLSGSRTWRVASA